MPYSADRATPFGDFLRDWRARAGITSAQAAERLGLSVGTWRGWEAGRGCSADPAMRLLLCMLEREYVAQRLEDAWRDGRL